jgi:hypothetical protein
MEDIIKHPFCKRRHPDFPSDSLYLVAPPDIMTMREEMWAKGGLDKSAVKRLMVILPEIREDELIEALFSEEYVKSFILGTVALSLVLPDHTRDRR